MKDIAIMRMRFPNDPTENLDAHQMFVSVYSDDNIELYSVSSIFGKEARVYGENTDDYFKIIGKDYVENGFKAPSFINCATSFVIRQPSLSYDNLTNREISIDLKKGINEKINDCKNRGVHTAYYINESDVKVWNKKL